jgi:hypothetical protein
MRDRFRRYVVGDRLKQDQSAGQAAQGGLHRQAGGLPGGSDGGAGWIRDEAADGTRNARLSGSAQGMGSCTS